MDHGRDGLELSIGYPTSKPTRLAMFSVLGALAVVASCVGGGALGATAGDGTATVTPVLLGGGLAVVAAAVMGLPLTRTVRTGAWLVGTRLTVRGLVSRTVDLTAAESVTLRTAPDPESTTPAPESTGPEPTAAAPESTTPDPESTGPEPTAAGPEPATPTRRRSAGTARRSAPVAPHTPTITVVGPEGTVTLPLRSRDGTMLPGAEMIALARAFSAASCPGAHEAVHWLHTMGSEPRTAGVGL